MGNDGDGDVIMVGCALSSKKVDTFITPTLITHAQKRRIYLIPVDLDQPLINQGPFHCLLHKIYTDDWNRELLDFQSKNPNCVIIDSPDAIQRLHNRVSMLDFITQLPPSPFPSVTFATPRQKVVDDDNAELLNKPHDLLKLLSFPIIAKPLLADGSARSHEMCLVFNAEGLIKLQPPIVLQEFVNHGGVVFKVYVAGNQVRCVKRRSLPDASSEMESQGEGGILSFSHISNMAGEKEANSLKDQAEMPPMDFVEFMAKELRQALRLHLFNFDMIRDRRSLQSGESTRYLVIDINYFPGYAKLPGYETILTDFIYDVVRHTPDHKDANDDNHYHVEGQSRAQLGGTME